MLARLLAFLRGGTRTFNDAEKRLLAFVLDALPPEERTILSAQISLVSLVQRQHPGRLIAAYYRRPDEVPTLPYSGYEYCLARVSYRSRGKLKTTSVVLHDGRLMTFERNVPQTKDDIEALVKVAMHPKAHKSVAEEIDTEEHGGERSLPM